MLQAYSVPANGLRSTSSDSRSATRPRRVPVPGWWHASETRGLQGKASQASGTPDCNSGSDQGTRVASALEGSVRTTAGRFLFFLAHHPPMPLVDLQPGNTPKAIGKTEMINPIVSEGGFLTLDRKGRSYANLGYFPPATALLSYIFFNRAFREWKARIPSGVLKHHLIPGNLAAASYPYAAIGRLEPDFDRAWRYTGLPTHAMDARPSGCRPFLMRQLGTAPAPNPDPMAPLLPHLSILTSPLLGHWFADRIALFTSAHLKSVFLFTSSPSMASAVRQTRDRGLPAPYLPSLRYGQSRLGTRVAFSCVD